MKPQHFADETTTGKDSAAFRYLGSATIAARTQADDDFEWLLELRRDHLPKGVELKSETVLEFIEHDKLARTFVLRSVGSASIFVIDFAEHYRSILGETFLAIGWEPPTAPDAVDIAAHGKFGHIARRLLEQARVVALYRTAVPMIESMLVDAMRVSGVPVGRGRELIDRETLSGLPDSDFNVLIARFAVAFGDASDPERQGKALAAVAEERFLPHGYLSFVTLSESIDVDLTFDTGSATVFDQVERAHDVVVERLAGARGHYLQETIRGGRIAQEDSKQVLGIQAADIAAGIAADRYQRFDNRKAGARALKKMFDRVLLNSVWI